MNSPITQCKVVLPREEKHFGILSRYNSYSEYDECIVSTDAHSIQSSLNFNVKSNETVVS